MPPAEPSNTPSPPARSNTRVLRNVLSNWANLGAAVTYSVLITPLVVNGLGNEQYGIWSWLNALVSYSGLFYLGLGTALIRVGARNYATADRPAINRLVSVVMTIYSSIGLLLLLIGLIAAPFIPSLVVKGGTVSSPGMMTSTVMVLAVRVALLFVGSVFSGVLVAQERSYLQSLVGISGHAIRFMAVPFAMRSGTPLYYLAVSVTVTAAAEVATTAVIAFRSDPELRARFVKPTSAEVRALYGLGLLAFVVQAADRIISYTDTTLIGLILGPVAVAYYSLPLQLVDYGRTIAFGIAAALVPHLSALHVIGEVEKIRLAYLTSLKATAFVSAYININIIALGPLFIELWVGPEYRTHAFQLVLLLGGAATVQACGVQSQLPFCVALGKLRFAATVLGAEAVANLGLSLLLIRSFGIEGVALATFGPAVLVSGMLLPIYVARRVGVPLMEIWRRVVTPFAWFVTAVGAGELVGMVLLPDQTYASLLLRGGLVTVIAGGAGWLLATSDERRLASGTLSRLSSRLRT